jgi:NTE family protein
VLGAGGITGFAYHSGALSALQQTTGWDPRTATVIVGTSAGAGVGAMLRGGVPVDEVMAHLIAAPANPETMARLRVLSGRDADLPRWWWFGPGSPRLLARELSRPWTARRGRVAASLLPNGRIPTDFLGDRVRRLHGLEWPDKTLLVCALRLGDGERVVFGSGAIRADVGTAVEASSAIPGFFRPVTVDGVRYVDGAVHSPTNADLLADLDLDLIVVSSPMSGQRRAASCSLDAVSRLPSWRSLRRELAVFGPATGHLLLEPGGEEMRTMGPINMDPTRLVPTVLQSRTSTLRRLAAIGEDPVLGLLRRAAATTPKPPDVAYPTGTERRTAS